MVAVSPWLSATRAVGLVAYGASALACSARCMAIGRRHGLVRFFAGLALAQLALLLDMAFDWRWKAHAYWMDEAIALHLYDRRRMPQLLALTVLGAATALAAAWTWRLFRHRAGAALALTGTLFSAGLWACESVSYHFVDRVFYRMVGPVMRVSLLWLGLAAVTSLGVWLDFRRSQPRN